MGWRSKFLFMLIIYFLGFATAIYALAPVPDEVASEAKAKGAFLGAVKSDEIAKSFNAGMHKCINLLKEMGTESQNIVRDKISERIKSGDD